MEKCRICGCVAEHSKFFIQEMMLGLGDNFEYFLCSKCKCLQITSYPENIDKYYPLNYYSYSKIKFNPVKSFFKKRLNNTALTGKGIVGKLLLYKYGQPFFVNWLNSLDLELNSKILDVGCGSGYLLWELSHAGFRNLVGIDAYIEKNIIYKDRVHIYKQSFLECEKKFDLIMFHHSFEHLPDQGKIMNHVHELLNPGGIALIRIPVFNKFAWRQYGTNWVQIDAPRHYYLHSEDSISFLAQKAQLKLFKVEFDSTGFQFWASEQYSRGISLKSVKSYAISPNDSIFSQEQINRFNEEAVVLNKNKDGDQACFYFSK